MERLLRLFNKNLPISRRHFFQTVGRAVGVSAIGAMASGTYAYAVEPRWLETNRHTVKLSKLPPAFAGTRVVQLSDLHHNEFLGREYMQEVLEATMAEKPDLILITGDFVTGFLGEVKSYRRKTGDFFLRELSEMLRKLKAPLGVWGCPGNHDFWYGYSTVKRFLRQSSVHLLRNEHVRLSRQSQSIVLVGLTDLWSEPIRWRHALRHTSRKECRLAMMHNPDSFSQAVRFGLDFVMCGHTHGGQISLPFIGPPILPIANRAFVQGWFHDGASQMYVNRGIGVIGIPIRFNARPEIAVFELQPDVPKA
jgi:predicted MPP superfamily phosphohydrolase